MEVTVPFSQSYRIRQNGRWEAFYRLYFSSTHFAFETVRVRRTYYKVNNSVVKPLYYVRAEDMRLVDAAELSPIHPEVSPQDKRIEISIDFQSLRAFEYDQMIKDMYVSTGLPTTSNNPNCSPLTRPKAIM